MNKNFSTIIELQQDKFIAQPMRRIVLSSRCVYLKRH